RHIAGRNSFDEADPSATSLKKSYGGRRWYGINHAHPRAPFQIHLVVVAMNGVRTRAMQHKDIVIIGGGLAGSTAAAMLGRAGISTALIDPHKIYPHDFRCEKLDVSQVDLLRKTGLADAIFAAATLDEEISVARFGRL